MSCSSRERGLVGLVTYSSSSDGETEERREGGCEGVKEEGDGDEGGGRKEGGRKEEGGSGEEGEEEKSAADTSPLRKRPKHSTEHDAPSPPLPLPPAICSMFQEENSSTVTSDPGLHDGRVRSFPHVRGQWATHVFIPFQLSEDLASCLTELCDYLKTTIIAELSSNAISLHTFPATDLHLSLSRTVPIPFHTIEPLTQALRERMNRHHKFSVSLSQLSWYCNDDSTRSFLSWDVSRGHDQLCALVRDVDQCFSLHNLKQFYQDPVFHVSLFWCVGDTARHITTEQLTHTQEFWAETLSSHSNCVEQTFAVSEVRCKTGNKLFTFPLCLS